MIKAFIFTITGIYLMYHNNQYKPMKSILRPLLLTIAVPLSILTTTSSAQYVNAVIPGDFADPSLIRKGNRYFAIGTSSEWAPHFPMFSSSNLKDWKQLGYVFDKAPEWTGGSFWAPEYYFHKGTYFVYYTARRKSDGISCIGVASSKYPDRGFKDHGILIEHGKEAIDAFVFNDNGQLYISFKAYGLDGRPIEILGSKLSDDGLSLTGELFSMMKDTEGKGLEGQSILKKDDYYYFFYSAGACCGSQCDYNVGVARSKTFQGPYEKYDQNPILQENEFWKCSGHGTFVENPEGKTFYLYHAYHKQSSVFTGRQGLVAELQWSGKNEWPKFKESNDPQTFQASAYDVHETFTGKTPSRFWQWDFRNSTPVLNQQKGTLHLSGSYKENNASGVVATLRPVAAAYEMTVTVHNQNDALKGLVIYGDANQAIGVGAEGDSLKFWMAKDNKTTILSTSSIAHPKLPVQLKLKTDEDAHCRVYWKQKDGGWQELKEGAQAAGISFLPPWDRSPRPGLNFKGASGQEAVFADFSLVYTAKDQ
ncbi:beta-xylosidase (1,4-beta-D-xylan xylosidase) [Pedobacter sp. BAL39]|nr:beta-xylosidase (1,4-beta-D-xylan xylosidase) [Pedobacter sp. BAL39]